MPGHDRDLVLAAMADLPAHAAAPVVFCGFVEADGSLRIAAVVGSSSGALQGLRVARGTGLGGLAAVTRRVQGVPDYLRATRITHQYDHVVRAERLTGMVAVPIVLEGATQAAIYCAIRGRVPLPERTIRATTDLARTLEHQLTAHHAVAEFLDSREGRLQQVALDSARDRSDVREGPPAAEFRRLARRICDRGVRRELLHLCDRLAGAPEPSRRANRLI
jgi:hypothetical protein